MVRMCFSIYRICSALLFLEFSVKLAAPGLYDTAYRFRPHIWFYEPSYAAIYYAAYVGSSLYLVSSDCRWARRDLVIAILSMGMLVSATAFMGVMFSLLICLLFSKHRLKLVLISAVVVLLPALGTAFYLQNNKIFLQIFGFLAKGDGSLYGLLMETVMRGGIRPMSFLWGIDAFRQNPWTGIGFGADQSYTAGTALPPEAAQFLTPWLLNVYGAPFINPFVEAAGTMGIPGLVAFCLLCAYPVVRFMQIRKSPDATMTNALFVGFFVMFLTLQDSGTFLRFYVWSGYAMAIGSAARLRMASA